MTFAAIPNIPTGNISEWQYQVLSTLKENVELLIGARGSLGAGDQAVTRGMVRVSQLTNASFSRVTATGQGYTISGQNVASFDDYVRLISDVQLLAADVVALRNTVNALLAQLKGQ